jgi:hypothetical protein
VVVIAEPAGTESETSGLEDVVISPAPAVTKAKATVSLRRSGKRLVVTVKAAGGRAVTGTVRVRLAGKVLALRLTKAARGKLVVKLSRFPRSKGTAKAHYLGSATVKAATATKKIS